MTAFEEWTKTSETARSSSSDEHCVIHDCVMHFAMQKENETEVYSSNGSEDKLL